MKRCPECGREYDSSMMFCLDDGAELLYGPSSVTEPATMILSESPSSSDNATRTFPPHSDGRTMVLDPANTAERAEPTTRSSNTKMLFVPVVIAVIALAGFLAYRYLGTAGSKQIESIAVMPFVNDGGNADGEYLSDGMTETLIRSLSQLPNLNVKSRSSVFRYKGKDVDPKTIANQLGVSAILNGRLTQRSDGLVLSLELIDTATENVLWAEQYDRKSSDLVSLQNEIARDVSSKLRSRLSGDDQQMLAKTYTTNPEAYKLYLQGRFFWNKRDESSFKKAVDYFTQAITIDPNYALAYAGLADTYALMSTFGFVSQLEGMPKAQEYARRAMSIDDTLAEPHTALAVTLQSYEYDLAGAEREYRRAIELNPNYLTGHQWYGEMLVCAGRSEEAAAQYRRALEIDPLSIPASWEYARAFYYARKFDESIDRHNEVLKMDPGFQGAYRTLYEAYRVKGEFAKATETLAKFFDLSGDSEKAALTRSAFARDGWKGVLHLMTAGERPLQLRHAIVARAYVELGQHDEAFDELNKAFEKRESPLQFLKVEAQFDPIRDDPRFKELLRKMNFSE